MTVIISGDQLRTLRVGSQVLRATATLPQTTTQNIFAVTGGRILLTSLVGEVTTVIQNQANNTKLTSTPTTGSAIDLCGVTDIAALEVGGKLALPNPPASGTALVKANAGYINLPTGLTVIPVGNIVLNCAASNTGSVKWSLTYVPLDNGASVAAA